MFPHIARGAGDQQPVGNAGQDKEEPNPEGQANPEGNANPEGEADAEGAPDPQEVFPRVRRRVDVDSILEEINQPGRPTTHSRTRLANFCGSFSFFSMLEPSKFDEALMDPDWLSAMLEELNLFESPLSKDLIPRSIISLARSGYFATSKMNMALW